MRILLAFFASIFVFTVRAQTEPITFTVTEPSAHAPVSTWFKPVAEIASEFEIQSVTATLSTQTLALAYFAGGWVASEPFDFPHMPSGNLEIIFSSGGCFGERSGTSLNWTSIQTNSVNALTPTRLSARRFGGSNPPGFFRVRPK